MVKIRQRTFDSTRVSYLLTHRIVAFAVVGAALTGCNTKPKVDSTVNGDSGRIRSVVVTQSKIPDSKTTPITAKSDAPQLTPLPLVPPSPVITSEIPALNASSDWQAGAKIEQLKSWAENHSKLFEAASALMLRNIEECPRATRKLLGFTAKNKYSYSSQYASAAEEGLGLSEQLQVMEVLPHSGAHDVGLKRGDLLLEFNGQPVPTGPNAEREAALAMGPEIRRTDRISLVIERHGERVSVDTPLTQACAFGLEYGDTDEINSYADGYRIMVTKGLLDFLESEEELSYGTSAQV